MMPSSPVVQTTAGLIRGQSRKWSECVSRCPLCAAAGGSVAMAACRATGRVGWRARCHRATVTCARNRPSVLFLR